jgi:hypothetical protein
MLNRSPQNPAPTQLDQVVANRVQLSVGREKDHPPRISPSDLDQIPGPTVSTRGSTPAPWISSHSRSMSGSSLSSIAASKALRRL